MDKVAIYCRLSDEDKNKMSKFDESESIQNQKNLLMKYAIEKGWDIYKIYSDDDYSGLDSDRPEFNQMIKEAQEKKFNIILCKHQSRFTRDMELVEKYLHNKFIEWGIRFITVVDGVDTLDKNNKKSRQINGLVNEWYCEDISESVKSVLRLKQEQGKFIGFFAAYGYKKDPNDNNKLIIDDESAEIVRKIFNFYLQGNGVIAISRILNQMNIPCPAMYKQEQGLNYRNAFIKDSHCEWNMCTIRRILKNEIYIGNLAQRKHEKVSYKSKKLTTLDKDEWIVVENTHEPIIDKNVFYEVQKLLKSKKRRTGSDGSIHVFAGKVRCLDCGSTMHKTHNGSKSTRNITRHYLKCRQYTYAASCTSHTIRLDYLEETVSEKIRLYINNLCDENNLTNELLLNSKIDNKINAIKTDIKRINKKIDETNLALKNIYLDKVKGLISEETFNEFQSTFNRDRDELLTKKELQEKALEDLNYEVDVKEKYINIIRKYKNSNELTHTMVNELIDFIEVGEKDKESGLQKIKIHWNF